MNDWFWISFNLTMGVIGAVAFVFIVASLLAVLFGIIEREWRNR